MNNNHHKLAIFDLDGTLLDTSEGVIAAVKYTIEYFSFKELSNEQLLSFIGPPIQDSFAKTYDLEGDILQDIATVFRDRYKNVDLFKAIPYDGIFGALKSLKNDGMKLAVATYKREDYALQILNHFKFDQFFDVMHGADHNNKLKKADIIELCITEMGFLNKKEIIYIGDTESDKMGANKVGIDFLGVNYGFGFKDIPDYANTPNDFKNMLQ